MKRVITCPYCNHEQKSKSQLKYVTCSSCQKKFKPGIKYIPKQEKKKEAKQIRLDY